MMRAIHAQALFAEAEGQLDDIQKRKKKV